MVWAADGSNSIDGQKLGDRVGESRGGHSITSLTGTECEKLELVPVIVKL